MGIFRVYEGSYWLKQLVRSIQSAGVVSGVCYCAIYEVVVA